jgi:hypothetical protein
MSLPPFDVQGSLFESLGSIAPVLVQTLEKILAQTENGSAPGG